MQNLIEQRINEWYTNSKIVVGFAWEWRTKNNNLNELVFNHDITTIGVWSNPWNYNDSSMT